MSKNLSEYCLNIIKEIRKDYKKKLVKELSKEEKEKNNNMVVNVTKISQKMKKINWLSIERNIIN